MLHKRTLSPLSLSHRPSPLSLSSPLPPKMAGKSLDSAEFWRENAGGGWFTAIVLFLIVAWKLLAAFLRRRWLRSRVSSSSTPPTTALNPNSSSIGAAKIVTDAGLKDLIKDLDDQESEKWEDVIDKKNDSISYTAKCCRPKDGPLKYWSTTIFEKCSTELLRDFYMDNEYRKEWDKTLIEYRQLEVDETSKTEIGCMIKKFPLLTPREYILAWRVWEGKDKTFYCVTKDCEHSLAPRQRKYVRVSFFRSGWRIRKVPGRDACEITMVHQEDAGLNVEMAKFSFSKGIWSYVCKMDNALREYSSRSRSRSTSIATMHRLIQKVPPSLEIEASQDPHQNNQTSTSTVLATTTSETKVWKKPSKKKLIANGLLLLGGIACLSRCRATLGTQVAMACVLKKLIKRRGGSSSAASVSRETKHSN